MTTRIKTIFLLLTCTLLTGVAMGQDQGNMIEYLKQRFEKYCRSVPREEIFLHSDREEYIAGEDLWFNIYLVDRQTMTPSLDSRIAYVELLNSENMPVAQQRVILDKGYGPGHMVISNTLPSGYYTLRAYTSWMKNFAPDNCFLKVIGVYNTFNDKASAFKSGRISFAAKGPGNAGSQKRAKAGVGLSVNNSKPGLVEIFVTADERFRTVNDLFYLFIQTHGNIEKVSSEKFSGDTTVLTLQKSLLSPGINQVTIFDSRGNPVGETYIYTPSRGSSLYILNSAGSYHLRDKIRLKIDPMKDLSEEPDSGSFSISVAPLTGGAEPSDINNYLVFGTEFGPAPLNRINGRKISEIPAAEMDSILSDLSSNWLSWSDILSNNPPLLRYRHENENHFLNGRLLNSDQQPASAGNMLFMCTPGKKPGFQYAETDNEGNFSFNIHPDEEQKDLIFMPDDISKNFKILIEPSYSDKFLYPEQSAGPVSSRVPACINKWSLNFQVMKIYGIPASGNPAPSVTQPLKPVRFYGKPDFELIMADYIKLPLMEEVIFELLPQVTLKSRNSRYEIQITYWIDDALYTTKPVLMIDGVLIRDASLIVNLDPETVEMIDLVKEKYLVGKYLFPSILNVITKSADFSSVQLPDYMTRLHYRVADPVPSFVSPDYSSEELKNSRVPDFRNTLYWNPSVKPGKDGKALVEFWSSDYRSDYLVTINGQTRDGRAVSIKKIISIK
ncbi:MAG: hypothetical protein ABR974_08555 [Bacteroidales bacterium]|jgi:hypothetical protein